MTVPKKRNICDTEGRQLKWIFKHLQKKKIKDMYAWEVDGRTYFA